MINSSHVLNSINSLSKTTCHVCGANSSIQFYNVNNYTYYKLLCSSNNNQIFFFLNKKTHLVFYISLSHTILNSYNQYLYAVYNMKAHNIIYYDHASLIQSIPASPIIKNQIANFHTSILNMKVFL